MIQPSSESATPRQSGLELLLSSSFKTVNLSATELRSLSPLALAYIGDAVYELYIRTHLLLPAKQVRTFHRQVVDHVRAEQQAYYLERIKPYLTEAELDILRRGRNAASSRKQRASLRDYQQATALEALIGYLYLADGQRLIEILNHLPLASDISQRL